MGGLVSARNCHSRSSWHAQRTVHAQRGPHALNVQGEIAGRRHKLCVKRSRRRVHATRWCQQRLGAILGGRNRAKQGENKTRARHHLLKVWQEEKGKVCYNMMKLLRHAAVSVQRRMSFLIGRCAGPAVPRRRQRPPRWPLLRAAGAVCGAAPQQHAASFGPGQAGAFKEENKMFLQ